MDPLCFPDSEVTQPNGTKSQAGQRPNMPIAQTLCWAWGHQWQSYAGRGRMAEGSSMSGSKCCIVTQHLVAQSKAILVSDPVSVRRKHAGLFLAGRPRSSAQAGAHLSLPLGSPEVSLCEVSPGGLLPGSLGTSRPPEKEHGWGKVEAQGPVTLPCGSAPDMDSPPGCPAQEEWLIDHYKLHAERCNYKTKAHKQIKKKKKTGNEAIAWYWGSLFFHVHHSCV